MAERSCRLRITTTVLAAMSLLACSSPSDTRSPAARVPGGLARFVDAATGSSTVSRETVVDFGRVRVGDEARRELRIRNDGSAAFTLVEVRGPDDAARAFEFPTSPVTVASNTETTLLLVYRPSTPAIDSAALMLRFTNSDPVELTVQLRGTAYRGDSPELAFGPGLIDFGSVLLGDVEARRLTLANVGTDVAGTEDDNLRFGTRSPAGWVDSLPALVGADAADFSFDWPAAGASRLAFASGERLEVRVRFHAVSPGIKNARLVLESNDAAQAHVEIALHAVGVPALPCELDVVPAALSFGALEVGGESTREVAIVNRDPNPAHACVISHVDLSPGTKLGTAFTLVDGPVAAASLPGGATLRVPLVFTPDSSGAHSGKLVVTGSDASTPAFEVQLTGVAESDCVLVTPPRVIDHGIAKVGCRSVPEGFSIFNRCTRSFTMTSFGIAPEAASKFEVWSTPHPASLEPGARWEFRTSYRPGDIGDDVGTAFVTLDGVAAPVQVALAGHGTAADVQTDVFEQAPLPKYDILFVVDNSATMEDKQASLARNFASYIHYMVSQKTDYHIAVTTTDVTAAGAAGSFVSAGTNPRIITPSTPNKEQVFSQNVQLGTSGSETESLIRPAYLALSEPLLSGTNAGFYRDEAKLSIFVISDAADQDPLGLATSFYENFFLSLKGVKRRNDFTFSAVMPMASSTVPGSGCAYDTASAGLDTRVKELVQRTGGLMDEICNPDWSKTLEKLGTRVFGLRTTFFLSGLPNLNLANPITVAVDGMPFPDYGEKGDRRWAYNSASNAVEFDPLAVPDPGSTLAISYYLACLQ